jgi:cobalt/nickel transport system permease protein
LRHVVVDEWSRGSSPLHRRDARAKLVALFLILVGINLPYGSPVELLSRNAPALMAGFVISGLPLLPFLARTALVLPFAGVFALFAAIGGDSDRAILLLLRSWLSIAAILLVAGTTPMPHLLNAMRRLGVPAMLVQVIQLVYRYLFVIAEQVWRMRNAAASRAGHASFRAAANTVTSLFARSYSRADSTYRAMLARGYTGDIPVLVRTRMDWVDWVLVSVSAALLLSLHRQWNH